MLTVRFPHLLSGRIELVKILAIKVLLLVLILVDMIIAGANRLVIIVL